MEPLDILIIVLIAFNVILGIMMMVVLGMLIGILREARVFITDVSRTYRYFKNLQFLPSAVAAFVFDHFFSKKGD